MSLPVPFKDYIPKIYHDDALTDVLAAEVDQHLDSWKQDVCDLSTLKDVARIRSEFLEELGYQLNAGLENGDSDATKRQKILSAVKGHKRRGSWADDAKPKVDAIAGGDATIQAQTPEYLWVPVSWDQPQLRFSTFTGWNQGTDQGAISLGDFTVAGIAGNIYIDVDNDSMTADQLDQLRRALADVVPAYIRVVVGYTDVGGNFVTYEVYE